jgi:hypothetical protein
MTPKRRLFVAAAMITGAFAAAPVESQAGDCGPCIEEGANHYHYFILGCSMETYADPHTSNKMGGCSNSHLGCMVE